MRQIGVVIDKGDVITFPSFRLNWRLPPQIGVHLCKGNCTGASRGSKEERMWIPARLGNYKPKYRDSGNNI